MTSAVLVAVPELQELVERAGGAEGERPPHVVLLAPFLPAAQVDAGVVAELEWFFAGTDGFQVQLDGVGGTPDALVLCPRDPSPLLHLAGALARRWPEALPGPLAGHVVALPLPAGEAAQDAATDVLTRGLPFPLAVRSAELWVRPEDGPWQRRAVLPLGQPEEED